MLKAAVGFVMVLTAAASGVAQSAHPLYGPQGVSPGAVKQGVLGSCYFHASIAALAMAEPDKLRAAIRKNFPIGYKVHFASGPDEAVYPDDIKYGRTHGFDESDGDWVLALMRAYAQREVRQSLVDSIQRSKMIPSIAKPLSLKWLNETDLMLVAYDRAIRAVVRQNGSMDKESLKQNLAGELRKIGIPASESQMLVGFLDEAGFFAAIAKTVQQNGEVFGAYKSLGQGGIPERVIEAFLGSAGAAQVSDQQAVLYELQRVRGGGMALVASTLDAPPDARVAIADWWVPSHAYTVMAYDENSGMVTLRNPWGTRPGPDGSFSLPFQVFEESFDYISYSQR
jgi:hypothetical protein